MRLSTCILVGYLANLVRLNFTFFVFQNKIFQLYCSSWLFFIDCSIELLLQIEGKIVPSERSRHLMKDETNTGCPLCKVQSHLKYTVCTHTNFQFSVCSVPTAVCAFSGPICRNRGLITTMGLLVTLHEVLHCRTEISVLLAILH
jgi:hypothetical protein